MKGTGKGRPTISCCSARLILPHVRKRWPFPWFFWKEVVNSSFTAPQWDSFANALFNQEQGDHRDGLCGREPGSLGSLWRAAVTACSEDPLPWALPVKAISATPLLLVPQVQGSLCGKSPSRAITCFWGMFLIHIKVKAAASVRQVSFGRTCGPPFISFFPLPFSCCCSTLQNVIRKRAIYKTNVSGRNSPEHPCHKIIEHSV